MAEQRALTDLHKIVSEVDRVIKKQYILYDIHNNPIYLFL